ncbi:MAG: thiazole biosynthesis adenylyltransferase ThiF, partial [Planctomycetaceae bacterium]|nr:thiazole biosynthesis adenylyltransferase ThiF [Planctomycetaceae bacterium]
PASPAMQDLAALSARWQSLGTVTANPFLARLRVAGTELELTVFRDGRAIIKGTDDPAAARTAYARYVGG